MGAIWFLIGSICGGLIATGILCCLQIHRIGYDESEIQRLKEKRNQN